VNDTPALAVIDYGAGNLTSVLKGLSEAGAFPIVTNRIADVRDADALVVPGVGHFAATQGIDAELRAALLNEVASGKPLLGICLGLQVLFEGSAEAPDLRGFALLAGRCARLTGPVKVPHVGWNSLSITRPSRLLDGIVDGAQVYFTHSYAAPVTEATVATTEHGSVFASVVEQDNVFGVQFHPEKSGEIGLRVLRSFLQITKSPNPQITKC